MYQIDVRKIAIRMYAILSSLRKTAKLLGVSHSSIHRWLSHLHRRPYARRPSPKADVVVDVLSTAVVVNPFVSLRKLRKLIKETVGVEVSLELLRTVIRHLGYSKKKAHHVGRPKHLPERTSEFLRQRSLFLSQHRSFVAIDETSFGRNGLCTSGYSRVGERLYVSRRTVNMQTMSACVCVNEHGIVARKLVKGAFNKTSFREFLESFRLAPGTVVLMDNVRFHHCKETLEWLHSRGIVVLFTPPYSPWFNPIELCFSIVKRKYYETEDVEEAFNALTALHCQAFFRKCLSCNEAF